MKSRVNIDCEHCESRESSVFCSLDKESIATLNLSKNCNTYRKGQTLFLEGNPAFGLYCIHDGKIKVTKLGSDGKETIVRIAGKGDLLGHRTLFSEAPYGASATVIEEARVCFVSKSVIMDLMNENPQLSFEIIQRLSQQMGAAEDKIASLAQKNTRERFAELLLLLKESHGVEKNGQTLLDIRLTREEMASMIGIATENVIRMVTEFKKDGLIHQEGKQIYLLDVQKIEKLAALNY